MTIDTSSQKLWPHTIAIISTTYIYYNKAVVRDIAHILEFNECLKGEYNVDVLLECDFYMCFLKW